MNDGTALEILLGPPLGVAVGCSDGSSLGRTLLLGVIDGSSDGKKEPLGFSLGETLDPADRDLLGGSDGDELGLFEGK